MKLSAVYISASKRQMKYKTWGDKLKRTVSLFYLFVIRSFLFSMFMLFLWEQNINSRNYHENAFEIYDGFFVMLWLMLLCWYCSFDFKCPCSFYTLKRGYIVIMIKPHVVVLFSSCTILYLIATSLKGVSLNHYVYVFIFI